MPLRDRGRRPSGGSLARASGQCADAVVRSAQAPAVDSREDRVEHSRRTPTRAATVTRAPRIVIDLAGSRDAGTIAAMSRDFIEHGLGWSWRERRVVRQISRSDACVIVARDRAAIRGFAIMRLLDRYARLDLFAVDPSHRRLGIGTRLVHWLEESVRTAGVGFVHLEVRERNGGGRAFYRALGYQELVSVPGYYGGVEAAVRMYRDIRLRQRDVAPR